MTDTQIYQNVIQRNTNQNTVDWLVPSPRIIDMLYWGLKTWQNSYTKNRMSTVIGRFNKIPTQIPTGNLMLLCNQHMTWVFVRSKLVNFPMTNLFLPALPRRRKAIVSHVLLFFDEPYFWGQPSLTFRGMASCSGKYPATLEGVPQICF